MAFFVVGPILIGFRFNIGYEDVAANRIVKNTLRYVKILKSLDML